MHGHDDGQAPSRLEQTRTRIAIHPSAPEYSISLGPITVTIHTGEAQFQTYLRADEAEALGERLMEAAATVRQLPF